MNNLPIDVIDYILSFLDKPILCINKKIYVKRFSRELAHGWKARDTSHFSKPSVASF